ncbi:MAG: SsrA-binding protein, partial [Patescibacteria group bacterium]
SNYGDELYLMNFQIPPYQPKNTPKEYDENRARKLLLHKKQINLLIGKLKEKGLTIVPLKVFIKKGLVKVEIALAKGMKKFEKREKIKKRDFEREVSRALKQY